MDRKRVVHKSLSSIYARKVTNTRVITVCKYFGMISLTIGIEMQTELLLSAGFPLFQTDKIPWLFPWFFHVF